MQPCDFNEQWKILGPLLEQVIDLPRAKGLLILNEALEDHPGLMDLASRLLRVDDDPIFLTPPFRRESTEWP